MSNRFAAADVKNGLSAGGTIETSVCNYYAGQTFGVVVKAQHPKNAVGVAELQKQFDMGDQYSSAIAIDGHKGHYMDFSQNGSFTLDLWVKDNWIAVTAKSFEVANRAMIEITKNLTAELELSANAVPIALSDTVTELSTQDRSAIESAVANEELTIPAGTEYSVSIASVSDNKVHGKVHYSNGVTGNFIAEKRAAGWAIVSYHRDK